MNNDFDEIPALEDFSDEINKNKVKEPVKLEVKTVNKTNENHILQEDSFGKGFKKGFLKRENQKNDKEIVDLTHVKSKNTKEIKEVQENMKNISFDNNEKFKISGMNNTSDWLNQELILKLAQNPKLLKAFTHPSFNEVILLLQKNPQEAKEKFGKNPEFNEFFKEFSLLMSEHFQELSKKSTKNFIKASSENDPQIEKILKDPKVKLILEKLEKEGKVLPEEIEKDEETLLKIDYLIKKGVLKTITNK